MGQTGLQQEMSIDLDRLWHRNMARDDRAISHNGKEARFPFLDLEMQMFLRDTCSNLQLGSQNVWYDTEL